MSSVLTLYPTIGRDRNSQSPMVDPSLLQSARFTQNCESGCVRRFQSKLGNASFRCALLRRLDPCIVVELNDRRR